MLAKKNRLDKKLFDQVFENGRTYHSNSLYLKLMELPNEKKFSVVVPKKVVKGAVRRIFLKRKIYNILKARCVMYENRKVKNMACKRRIKLIEALIVDVELYNA